MKTKQALDFEDRVEFRIPGNQGCTGLVVIAIGLFFGALELLLGGEAEMTGLCAGPGLILIAIGVWLHRRGPARDYVDAVEQTFRVDGEEFDFADVGAVVTTDETYEVDNAQGRGTTTLTSWSIYAVIADEPDAISRRVELLADRLEGGEFDESRDHDTPPETPRRIHEDADTRDRRFLTELCAPGDCKLLRISTDHETNALKAAKILAEGSGRLLLDVCGEDVDRYVPRHHGLSLAERLRESAPRDELDFTDADIEVIEDDGEKLMRWERHRLKGVVISTVVIAASVMVLIALGFPEMYREDPLFAAATVVIASGIPLVFGTWQRRDTGTHRLAIDSNHLRYDTSFFIGPDQSIPIDELKSIRLRRTAEKYGDDELAILSDTRRIVVRHDLETLESIREVLRRWIAAAG